jgi:hypothetical protein
MALISFIKSILEKKQSVKKHIKLRASNESVHRSRNQDKAKAKDVETYSE